MQLGDQVRLVSYSRGQEYLDNYIGRPAYITYISNWDDGAVEIQFIHGYDVAFVLLHDLEIVPPTIIPLD